MNYAEVRKAFTDYFSKHQHQVVESSRLIPNNDPTLMFTNAGMNQFKDVFLGTDRRPYNRAVTIQKCLRAGGKHNDLENVGFTARHHTFFEMLGNFSFGDYFKREAIHFAWEFLTVTLKIPKERLYITVFTTDDEAFEIWEKEIGIPKEKITRYGEKDNFWRMGQTGPCGPCSEIFYDHNPGGPKVALHEDEARFVEIWNLVFMQFFEDESGKQTPLPKPSVDTGAGIERMAAALQGFTDNYQCDIFQPLIHKACEIAGISADWNILKKDPAQLGAVKVVADHARAATFLIGEGVLPSNEGRGYVLRRIMRRAIRYGRQLNDQKSLYPAVCEQVIKTMSPFYPELKEKAENILQAVKDEEKRFLQTLDKGSEILNQNIQNLKKNKKTAVDGETAFTLYDTFGFPYDLTELIAKEQGLTVDEDQFNHFMNQAKMKARKAQKTHLFSSNDKHLSDWTQKLFKTKGATEFIGYEKRESTAQLIGLSDGEKEQSTLSGNGLCVFNQTPFYAEGGGQVGDQGWLLDSQTGDLIGEITDCKKINDCFIHTLINLKVPLEISKTYTLKVNQKRRDLSAQNHSATHLMHAALKKVLGTHVQQAGSLVTPDKLRFDFNHNSPVSEEQIYAIEQIVNGQISASASVVSKVMEQKEAIALGAVAMFGEKYGDQVRVIRMGEVENSPFSMELCGGTHVENLSQIRLFKIISESGVAAGVRRIEAITSDRAFDYLNQMAEEYQQLRQDRSLGKVSSDDLIFLRELRNLPVAKPWMALRESLKKKSWVPTTQERNQFESLLADLDPSISLSSDFEGALKVFELNRKIEEAFSKNTQLQKEIQSLKSQSISTDDLIQKARTVTINGQPGLALISRLDVTDRALLSETADRLRDLKTSLVVALIGESDEGQPKPLIVAMSKNIKGLNAGNIVKEICQILGGKGGGRPDFAQGSVENLDKLNVATEKFYQLLTGQ